jgi:cytoskeletal protein CcmA (bactofilin family)
MRKLIVPLIALFSALLLFASEPLGAQDAGEFVVKRGAIKEDLYLAGGTVEVLATVEGDVLAAGGFVTVAEEVRGDAMVAGGNIILRGTVRDDARVAGGNITLSGDIGDDALAGGGNIVIAPSAIIGGRTWLAGGRMEIAGRMGRELSAVGGHIVLAGEVKGDATLIGESIEVRPTAVIHGSLRYMSADEAVIDPAARITGGVVRLPGKPPRHGPPPGLRIGFVFSLAATGVVLLLLFPKAAPAAAVNVGATPWKSLGLGLAVLAATPLLVAVLFATVIGAWLALMLLAIYLVALLLGYLNGVLWLAGWGLGMTRRGQPVTAGWRMLAFVVALVVLGLLGLVPVLGCVIAFVLLLAGLGALALHVWRGYVAAPAAARPSSGRRRR